MLIVEQVSVVALRTCEGRLQFENYLRMRFLETALEDELRVERTKRNKNEKKTNKRTKPIGCVCVMLTSSSDNGATEGADSADTRGDQDDSPGSTGHSFLQAIQPPASQGGTLNRGHTKCASVCVNTVTPVTPPAR